jgi:uncharacterized repeat protein (TIGR03943 family)
LSESGQIARSSLANRWLGVGLASLLSITTLVLAVTGRLTLYIAPETVWFASAAAVVTLLCALWVFVLPLGVEEGEHDHDHGGSGVFASIGAAIAGTLATAFVVATLVLPPASLSVELAMSRVNESGVLFAGADNIVLGDGDTSHFGVGDWSTVFATATRPEKYDGVSVSLVGFITPAGDDPNEVQLTRMVITHCVIDAQPASLPVSITSWQSGYSVGDWIEIVGIVRATEDGTLWIEPSSVELTEEPWSPYEF